MSDPVAPRPFAILLVEDNRADVHLVREALSSRGIPFELEVVEDGEKALKLLDEVEKTGPAAVDLMLLDLNLPRSDGMQVLRRIRASESLSTIPVIILTSSDSLGDLENAMRLGALTFVQKSSSVDEFMKLGDEVARVLNWAPQSR